MIDIPPEAWIKGSIQPGSVFYFPDEALSSSEPHFFILLNHKPLTDNAIILVCASSQLTKVWCRRRDLPETVVEIKSDEYAGFTKDFIVDCNNIWKRSIPELVKKVEDNKLKLKPEMPIEIVDKLRAAVISSPLVEQDVKDLLTLPLPVDSK